METREEVEENDYGCYGIFGYGLDDLLDHGHSEDDTEDLGSVQYIRNFEGMIWVTLTPSQQILTVKFSPPQRKKSSLDIENSV